jgi:hypothetical protein
VSAKSGQSQWSCAGTSSCCASSKPHVRVVGGDTLTHRTRAAVSRLPSPSRTASRRNGISARVRTSSEEGCRRHRASCGPTRRFWTGSRDFCFSRRQRAEVGASGSAFLRDGSPPKRGLRDSRSARCGCSCHAKAFRPRSSDGIRGRSSPTMRAFIGWARVRAVEARRLIASRVDRSSRGVLPRTEVSIPLKHQKNPDDDRGPDLLSSG